jgi:hypothetical protein
MTKEGILATANSTVWASSQDEALNMLHNYFGLYFGDDEYEITELEGRHAATAMGAKMTLWEVSAVAQAKISATDA